MPRSKQILLLVVALACLGLVAPPLPASASELVTDEDLVVLADEVERDPSLFPRLEEVERVEGGDVDLEVPFAIDDAADRSARLAELKRVESTPMYDAAIVRSAAQAILDDEPFSNPDPNVIQRLLQKIDDAYQAVIDGFTGFFAWLFRRAANGIEGLGLPRPGSKFAWTFTVVMLTGMLVAAFRLLRFRQRGERALADETLLGGSLLPDANADPDDYERRAKAAESTGDLAEALRLWFAVGVLRLHRSKRIRYRSTTTMADLRTQVNDPVFDRTASIFEWSVYGGYVPAASDLARFRSDWELLLEPARATS